MKKTKCVFGRCEVAYLGHVISTFDVVMDEQKVCVILDWPIPRSVCVVHAFLGLEGYYCQFVQDYNTIAVPLTRLLCKDGFL
jgi:hypothetical protein